MILETAYIIYVILVGAAILCSLWRLWQGPSIADRINAADVIALCFVGLAIGHGWKRGDSLWLDVAMVGGLVLFVGTTAVALFITPADLSEDKESS
jgi:multicomponent K+:H+ antiporter subunit F